MNTVSEDDTKGPGVKFPPPLITLVVILVAYGLHILSPLTITRSPVVGLFGYALVAISLLIVIIGVWSFSRAKTSIEPWKPDSAIIQHGIFSCSRNPIYLAFCVATIGAGLVVNSWWVVLSVVPLAMILYYFVIRREEAYLRKKFGEEYLAYQNKVRRWL
ncbi:MAG: isoprenylcysteine carboxylmethyltransferase family protein [Gammaproteobacteria bacterium]